MEGPSAGKRHFRVLASGWWMDYRSEVMGGERDGSLAMSREVVLRTQRRVMPIRMVRRGLDLECKVPRAQGDFQFSIQSAEPKFSSLKSCTIFYQFLSIVSS